MILLTILIKKFRLRRHHLYPNRADDLLGIGAIREMAIKQHFPFIDLLLVKLHSHQILDEAFCDSWIIFYNTK